MEEADPRRSEVWAWMLGGADPWTWNGSRGYRAAARQFSLDEALVRGWGQPPRQAPRAPAEATRTAAVPAPRGAVGVECCSACGRTLTPDPVKAELRQRIRDLDEYLKTDQAKGSVQGFVSGNRLVVNMRKELTELEGTEEAPRPLGEQSPSDVVALLVSAVPGLDDAAFEELAAAVDARRDGRG